MHSFGCTCPNHPGGLCVGFICMVLVMVTTMSPCGKDVVIGKCVVMSVCLVTRCYMLLHVSSLYVWSHVVVGIVRLCLVTCVFRVCLVACFYAFMLSVDIGMVVFFMHEVMVCVVDMVMH